MTPCLLIAVSRSLGTSSPGISYQPPVNEKSLSILLHFDNGCLQPPLRAWVHAHKPLPVRFAHGHCNQSFANSLSGLRSLERGAVCQYQIR